LRIISGEFKGRKFQLPKGLTLRPTTDFAKEGLFNVLRNLIDFEEKKVLDLFAGTGSLSLEFISRGAIWVLCVDLNEQHCRIIRDFAAKIDCEHKVEAIKADVFKFLDTCNEKFDIIVADPPYELKNLEKIPDIIFQKELLNKNGILVFEHSLNFDFTQHPRFIEHRKYGSVNFSFFE
jgi:16S rRNA (guanine(966)-N(2))-methyltransferase RsmD